MKPPNNPLPIRLRLVLLAALATASASSSDPLVAQPAAFSPPEGPVMVSRTLVRHLPDGNEVRTVRSYRVWFTADGDGFRVDGELAGVKVDAPAILAGLAAIERSRTDPHLFPVRLDGAGRILPGGVQTGDGARVRAAELGQAMLNQAPLTPEARKDAGLMLQQVSAAASAQTAWPVDLFNPGAPETREQRPIALPAGDQGSVEIVVRASGRGPGRLPGSVERLVVTDLNGSRRSSREVWTFEPAN
jgi:hypothetical protein